MIDVKPLAKSLPKICPYCHDSILASEIVRECTDCNALIHAPCWTAHKRCMTCNNERFRDVRIPGTQTEYEINQTIRLSAPRRDHQSAQEPRLTATTDAEEPGFRERYTRWVVSLALISFVYTIIYVGFRTFCSTVLHPGTTNPEGLIGFLEVAGQLIFVGLLGLTAISGAILQLIIWSTGTIDEYTSDEYTSS